MLKLKKILCLALAAMTAVAMTSCGSTGGDSSATDSSAASGEKTSVDIVKEQGYIVMSTNAEFEPFE